MSVPGWYFDWAAAHSVAFGFAEKAAETVLAWGPVFVRLFSPDELYRATEHLTARDDAPKWAADHRGAIIAAVRHLRQKDASRSQPESYAAGVCQLCEGAGVVIVPHPGLDEFGRWRAELLPPSADPDGERGARRTAAVCCVVCEKGRTTRDRSVEANRPLMTINDYVRAYPGWQDVQDERVALLTAGRDTGPPTAAQVEQLNRELDAARKAAEEKDRTRPRAA